MICPCSSGKKYSDCCALFHEGKWPATVLELMRSRYSAYALKDADYIIQTTHPKSPYFEKDKEKWRNEILEFCNKNKFLRLEILESKENTVHFIAHLSSCNLEEKSLFEKVDGKWLYLHRL